jgi:integrase
VKYITKQDVANVFAWLAGRFPGFDMPVLFFRVKAVTACRLEDLCSLPSDSLRDGGILFPANLKKNRKEHFSRLPDDLYRRLLAYRGKRYVWENYPAELIACNKRKGFPSHRQNPTFDSRRLYLWVVQIMGDYQKQTGKDFSSHDFKRAALTRAAENGVHPKQAAAAFDTTAETLMRYYTAVDARKANEITVTKLAADLDPTIPS